MYGAPFFCMLRLCLSRNSRHPDCFCPLEVFVRLLGKLFKVIRKSYSVLAGGSGEIIGFILTLKSVPQDSSLEL